MEEKIPITERLEKLEDIAKTGKVKELRFPARAKVRGSKLKKGWIGVLRVGENGNCSGQKVQIKGSVFKEKDGTATGTYHATDGREVLFWDGKFPFIMQEDKKVNPKIFTFNEGVNETYGQEPIMATMWNERIKPKNAGSMKGLIIIGAIVVVGYVLGKYVFKWF